MKITLMLVLFICYSGVGYCMGERLIGDWKSDKERTMAYLKAKNKFSEPQLAKLESMVGQLTVSYDGKHMHAKMGETEAFDADYRVVGDSPKMIIIEEVDSKTQKKEQDKLRFDGDAYWITDERVPGFAECFVRVAQKQ